MGFVPTVLSIRRIRMPYLSARTLAGIPFVDMKKVDEKKRYDLIVKYLKENPGRCTAVMVESGGEYEGKGDRYIAGIRELIPDVELVSRKPGPVPETETILLRIKA